MKRFNIYSIALLLMVALAGCNGTNETHKTKASYAIYAEYAKGLNKVMQNGLNRRMFDTTEAQAGTDIRLEKDGSIILKPGTYHITGFSAVTMQITMEIVVSVRDYPGYCLVYPSQYEKDSALVLQHRICVGSPGTALDTAPSLFDVVYTCTKEDTICVGHQSGKIFNNEVYLSVYDVAGEKSPYHVFSRVSISKL
jgi:hypothetical protein